MLKVRTLVSAKDSISLNKQFEKLIKVIGNTNNLTS